MSRPMTTAERKVIALLRSAEHMRDKMLLAGVYDRATYYNGQITALRACAAILASRKRNRKKVKR